jgi:hypothetical protein
MSLTFLRRIASPPACSQKAPVFWYSLATAAAKAASRRPRLQLEQQAERQFHALSP